MFEHYNKKDFLEGLKMLDFKCKTCNSKDFEIIGDTIINETYDSDGRKKGGCIIITVKLICNTCGIIHEINPLKYERVAREEAKEYSGWPIGLIGKENDRLTERQQRFVSEYIKDKNIEMAAIRAGYPAMSAHANGTYLMCCRKIIKSIKNEREKKKNEI